MPENEKTNQTENEKTNQVRKKKKLVRAAAMLLVVGLVISLNLYLTEQDYRVDVSEGRIYTLSEESRKLLEGIDVDVTIYVMGQEEEINPTYKKILEEYTAAAEKIHLQYCPRDTWDQLARDYGVEDNNIEKDSILIVSKDRSRFISSGDYVTYGYTQNHSYEAREIILEQLTTEALYYVVTPDKTTICFLTGHGEREPANNLVNVLEGKGCKVSQLDLTKEEQVPEECSVLVINGSAKEWTGGELGKVKDYMDAGGKLYIFVDPTIEKQPAIERLLAVYGLKLQKGVVVEKDPAYFSRYEIYLVPEIQDTEITADLIRKGDKIILPAARAITMASGKKKDEEEYGLTLFLASSRTAYSKVDLDSSSTDKEKEDIGGPFALSLGAADGTGGRMIVTGCVNMLEENVNRASGGANLNFVVNGLEYLSRREGSVTVKGKGISEPAAAVPAFDQKMLLVFMVFLVPLLIMAAGIAVVIRRRRR